MGRKIQSPSFGKNLTWIRSELVRIVFCLDEGGCIHLADPEVAETLIQLELQGIGGQIGK